MLYNDYEVVYYRKPNLEYPVINYLNQFKEKERAKIEQYIILLKANNGKLAPPYSKHISGKIWEIRIKYNNRNHRIMYFVDSKRKIVMLSAFTKKSKKTPPGEISLAYNFYLNYINIL